MLKWVDKVVRIIVDLYGPDEIILFGSCAKNNQNLQSDIDLLVIKDTDVPYINRGIELFNILAKFPIKIDLLFLTHREFEDETSVKYSFINSIVETGVFLYKKT